ncbi:hypothetical protein CAEBREN_19263 [Caenorhabditis brenneri]|uniref:Uncharacterized protein n=1 Tax=Caenorhabditis brenneri TaxID=135651 RepID=G0P3U2_CAEBE|nr:hypothetical protein CAEBREN_19263 [Caenorhabditis brenneri]
MKVTVNSYTHFVIFWLTLRDGDIFYALCNYIKQRMVYGCPCGVYVP